MKKLTLLLVLVLSLSACSITVNVDADDKSTEEVSYNDLEILSSATEAELEATLFVEKQELKDGDSFVGVCAPDGVEWPEWQVIENPESREMPALGDVWGLHVKLLDARDAYLCRAGIQLANDEVVNQGAVVDLVMPPRQ
ncbi:hypothetical protein KJ632_01590 [Patescibacteria group bacterium]|nr:hypothetical protein [Patescibacteria group bacterium]